MDPLALALFASVYCVAVASPGPGVAAIVARGLAHGMTAGPAFVAGFVVGDLIWFLTAATGLAALARSFETAFVVVKYAGCAYLPFMAWRIWTAPVVAPDFAAGRAGPSHLGSFLSSLSLTLGNPKVMAFFLSIMPIVVDVRGLTTAAIVEMAAVIVLVIAPTMAAMLALADRARRVFASPKAVRMVNRGAAGVMAASAAAIAARG